MPVEKRTCDHPEEYYDRNDVLTDLQTEQLDRSALAVGDWVDCFCPANETWYEARLVVVQDDDVKIHFHKWPTKFDEWMPREGIESMRGGREALAAYTPAVV